MTCPRIVALAVAAGSLAWLADRPGVAEPGDHSAGQASSVARLPRLQRLWSLPGLGRFEGASAGRIYYTVANDGKSVHAVDVALGRSIWQTPLANPVNDFARVRLHGNAVLVAYARPNSTDAEIAAVSFKDGHLAWARTVPCENPDFRSAGQRLFLICRGQPVMPPVDYREIDPATGRITASIRVDQDAALSPNGSLCGSSEGSTWCGRLRPDRAEVLWTQPAGKWANLTLTTDYVIERAHDELAVRRAQDGRVAWKKPGRFQIEVQERAGRLILLGRDGVEVVQVSDGRSLARFPMSRRAGASILADGDRILVYGRVTGNDPILVIDAQLKGQLVANNVPFLSHVAGDVVLCQNVGMSGINRENAPLEGYSLSRFAPPEADLDPYHKVVAILERFPFRYQAHDALLAVRPVPEAMAALEKIVANDQAGLTSSAAITVAGLSGDPRFVAPLRARLEAVTEPPKTVNQWSEVLDIVEGLADLRSPEVPVTLLAFWNRVGLNFSPPWRRTILKDFVASAVWKYGAHKQLVRCEDTTFSVERTDPQQARLGTAAPGVAYVVDGGRRWAAICEARQDDDENGKLQVRVMQHGDTGGDQLRPYLVLGAGKGTEIDDFVASEPSGRWVVTTKDMCVHLVDTQTGKAVALRGADGRSGDSVGGEHRAAAFSPDGKSLLYIKSNGLSSIVIQRDLRTEAERPIDPGPGDLTRAFFDHSGRFVVMEVVARDTDRDGLLTQPRVAATLADRRCRAPVASASFFGEIGDKPVQRVASVDGGAVGDAPPGPPLLPPERPRLGYGLASQGPRATGRGDLLPIGPFHWETSRPSEHR